MIDAMKHEDKLLHQYIEKNRLTEWLPTTLEAARVEVDATLDDATKNAVSTEDRIEGRTRTRSLFQNAERNNGLTGNPALFSRL